MKIILVSLALLVAIPASAQSNLTAEQQRRMLQKSQTTVQQKPKSPLVSEDNLTQRQHIQKYIESLPAYKNLQKKPPSVAQ